MINRIVTTGKPSVAEDRDDLFVRNVSDKESLVQELEPRVQLSTAYSIRQTSSVESSQKDTLQQLLDRDSREVSSQEESSSKEQLGVSMECQAEGRGTYTPPTLTVKGEQPQICPSIQTTPDCQTKSVARTDLASKVRLLTINLFLRPPGITNKSGNDYKEARLRQFFDRHIDHYDVICFQETFSLLTPWKERIASEAQRHGFYFHVCSPKPWLLFDSAGIDGGLLIISRYPIVDGDFYNFESMTVLADCFANKGLLYAKIDLSSLAGQPAHLHLFNTHTQATENEIDTEVYVQTYLTRYEQIKEIKQLIKEQVFEQAQSGAFDPENDLVILAGDFNQNATLPLNPQQKGYLNDIRKEERYRPILPLFVDEYRSMLNGLKNERAPGDLDGNICWSIIDCLRTSQGQGKFSPPTYADTEVNSHGVEHPCDPILHEGVDAMSKQALDYILWLVPESPTVSQSLLCVNVEDTRIEKLPCSGIPCNFCSDHFGISTVITRANPTQQSRAQR